MVIQPLSKKEKIGILMINLGTPDAPTPDALRRYLAEFLWDRRVVDLPRILWWPILHGLILRTRPRRSARNYQKIWGSEGSPLLAISRRQESALRELVEERWGKRVVVALGMRYGTPSVARALRSLASAGATKVVVLPLYPQYSCSTTASSFDAVAEELRGWRALPELRVLRSYHDHPAYIDALAASIREVWEREGAGQLLLFSFHGTPLRYCEEGDPYYDQCHETALLVAERLGLAQGQWRVAFQSRFGREEWLKPYADEMLEKLPLEGIKGVDLICPGFSADCLETLEEMAVENRRHFLARGGTNYRYIPALNDRPDHIRLLLELVQENSAGWW